MHLIALKQEIASLKKPLDQINNSLSDTIKYYKLKIMP